ncbi:MAG: ester cyclase [Alphaproteobacteria bacterium]|nr:ester cyclase [Alphaproteobacteria bacterium]
MLQAACAQRKSCGRYRRPPPARHSRHETTGLPTPLSTGRARNGLFRARIPRPPRLGINAMPTHDLAALWEAHCRYEFETRDVDATMATMVEAPYVNHVPTLTGGVGHDQLKRFYKYHFIGGNPPDTALTPVSRTIGTDQIVDEMIFSFTHTSEVDWMLPGVAPTGRRVEVPLVAIVRFVDGKVAHEHIYWDQASVLVQVGLLEPKGLPVAGIETARKVVDKTLPSNEMMPRWSSSAGKPL